ncbi:MAG: mycofactocin biosynthesis chaperone MftB [Actinomycetia bacterium]|nr:mycofactocin biosynthesis chaperone MftB [Actinomycetes bacterium]
MAASQPGRGFEPDRGFDPDWGFDPDLRWHLHPQVAVRPEPFGALLYHFGTRKLSFLKNRTIVGVVNSLADHPDVRSACRAAGIDEERQAPYIHALGVLAQSKMLIAARGQTADAGEGP